MADSAFSVDAPIDVPMGQLQQAAASSVEKIQAAVFAIRAADDERDPPGSGIMDREMKRPLCLHGDLNSIVLMKGMGPRASLYKLAT